ncbi:MAG: hypothetical protein HC876_13975 [Chloroflexaceae bacterium]|nr:hypothetical protein [Chloroflexaceae bacterium]NJO06538.1 hypothetical protein [Chloroflexaceae bacterium]
MESGNEQALTGNRLQRQTMQDELALLGRQNGIHFAMLLDLNGQEIATWSRWANLDHASISVLAAGEWLASHAMSWLTTQQRVCRLLIQEYETQRMLIAPVTETMVLLVVTAQDVPIGWARLHLQRMIEKLRTF